MRSVEDVGVIDENDIFKLALQYWFEFAKDRCVDLTAGGETSGVVGVQPEQCWLINGRNHFWQLDGTIALEDRDLGQPTKPMHRFPVKLRVKFNGQQPVKIDFLRANHIAEIGTSFNEYSDALL